MRDSRRSEPHARKLPRASGVLLLALALVAGLWAASYFGAEARILRASARVVRLAEKTGEESPVALGLAANRLGKSLAVDAVLEMDEHGALATGRPEIVQVFAQVRSLMAQITFADPKLVAATVGKGAVDVRVAARYRLAGETGEVAEGDGQAELQWRKGEDGWLIQRTVLRGAEGTRVPGGWK